MLWVPTLKTPILVGGCENLRSRCSLRDGDKKNKSLGMQLEDLCLAHRVIGLHLVVQPFVQMDPKIGYIAASASRRQGLANYDLLVFSA
jgi:hypothetical protein